MKQASKTQNQTLCSYLPTLLHRDSEAIALKYKKDNVWAQLSWSKYFKKITSVYSSLQSLDVKDNDCIGIISNTRLEWATVDWAILGGGHICVPLYPNLSIDDFEYIVNNSNIKILFIENKSLLRQWLTIKARCPTVEKIIIFDFQDDNQDPLIMSYQDFLKQGVQNYDSNKLKFIESCNKINPEQTATIIYTSGTTGLPKGVELTHKNIFYSTHNSFKALGVNQNDTTLSILPYSHVLGRTEHFGHVLIGFTLVFAESIEKVRSNLKDIQPTILLAVPRIFEKIYTSIKLKLETNFIQRGIFQRASDVGILLSQKQQKHESVSIFLFLKYLTAKTIILDNIKTEIFGNNLRFIISGGAPLAKEVSQFFHSIGVLVLEGYGLTETSGPITVNRQYDYEFGTVGKPIEDVQIKIADDGEILIKGFSVMKSYYKDPAETALAIKDGWLYTGDIGEFKADGKMIITERKKDLIKTANGKYVAPQKLEGLLKQLPFISHVHIHGDQKKYIVALLTLNKSFIINFAKENNIQFNSLDDLKDKDPIMDLARKGVASINQNLASHESIQKFALLANDFTIESGELTPSLKVKRKVIDDNYRNLIQSLYF